MKADFMQKIEVDKGDIQSLDLHFTWRQDSVGFGECGIHLREDGTIVANTECMSKEWLRRALHSAVDAMIEKVEII